LVSIPPIEQPTWIRSSHCGTNKAEPLLLKAFEGRHLKFGDSHPHTLESLKNLMDLYNAWSKPEKAKKWQEKLLQAEIVSK